MKKTYLKSKLTDRQVEGLVSSFAEKNHYDQIINSDCDCYNEQGKPVLFLRKKYIEKNILDEAYINLLDAAKPTSNRGSSSGGDRKFNITKKGEKTKSLQVYDKITGQVVKDKSGTIGFFDRSGHYDFCRTTAFNIQNESKFKKGMPLIETVDKGFREIIPERYKKQKSMVMATDPNYRIGNTSFSTITVNKDYRTAFHRDAGDYPEGFGNLVAYCKDIEPVYLVLPKYKVAVNLDTYDLLLVDVHQVHGNTKIIKKNEKGVRLSFVMYYRHKMYKCLPPKKELERIQQKQRSIGQRFIAGDI
tara:strand:+ start:1919 stop:2827 length:909 start_codon:yes stop_codon:yes gene_type:complete